CIPRKAYSISINTPIKNPELFVREVLLTSLSENSIPITGVVNYTKANPNLTVLAVHHSAPLTELIKTMLKKSDNIIANSLINAFGANYFHRESNWNDGALAINAILTQEAKVDMTKANIADGCGLSRYNVVTPQQLSSLLKAIFNS